MQAVKQMYPSGKFVDALNLRESDIEIEDIAHHLSMLCRYTGGVSRFYSVAEHSVRVAHYLPTELQLVGLLHDATEAYLGDVDRELKHSPLMEAYRQAEARAWAVIAVKFSLPALEPDEVKRVDNAILYMEASVLKRSKRGELDSYWERYKNPDIPENQHLGWDSRFACEMFLAMFHALDCSRNFANIQKKFSTAFNQ